MERKFSFDDMMFTARSQIVDGTLHVGIFDAWGDRLHASEQPAQAKVTRRGKKASAASVDETSAIDALIADFKRKVEAGEIDLA
jgi:hypothetical protein